MAEQIKKSIHIAVPPTVVFDITQDYDRRLEWDTFLKKAELINAEEAEVGVKAWCVSKYGVGMETCYVSFNRPKVTAVEMSDSSIIFKSFAGSWRFELLGEHSTQVTFTYSYELKFPFTLVSFLITAIFGRNVNGRLVDLKHYVESKYPQTTNDTP